MKKSQYKRSSKVRKISILGILILGMALFTIALLIYYVLPTAQTPSINKAIEYDPSMARTTLEKKAIDRLNNAATAEGRAKTKEQKERAAAKVYVTGQVVQNLANDTKGKLKDRTIDDLEKEAKDSLIRGKVLKEVDNKLIPTEKYDYTKKSVTNSSGGTVTPQVLSPATTTTITPGTVIDPATGKCVEGTFGCPYKVAWADDKAQGCGGVSVSGFYCYGNEYHVINLPSTLKAAGEYFTKIQTGLKNAASQGQLAALVGAQPGNTPEEKMDNYLRSLSVLDKNTRAKFLTEFNNEIKDVPTNPPAETGDAVDPAAQQAAADKQRYEDIKQTYESVGGILKATNGNYNDPKLNDNVAFYLQYEIDMAKKDPKFVGEYQETVAAKSAEAIRLTTTYDDNKCGGKVSSSESCVYSGITLDKKKIYSIKPASAKGVTVSMDSKTPGKVTSVDLGKKYIEYQFGIGNKVAPSANLADPDKIYTTDAKLNENGNYAPKIGSKTALEQCQDDAKKDGGTCEPAGQDVNTGLQTYKLVPPPVLPAPFAPNSEDPSATQQIVINENGNIGGSVSSPADCKYEGAKVSGLGRYTCPEEVHVSFPEPAKDNKDIAETITNTNRLAPTPAQQAELMEAYKLLVKNGVDVNTISIYSCNQSTNCSDNRIYIDDTKTNNKYIDIEDLIAQIEKNKDSIEYVYKYEEILKTNPKAFGSSSFFGKIFDIGKYLTKDQCTAKGIDCVKVTSNSILGYEYLDKKMIDKWVDNLNVAPYVPPAIPKSTEQSSAPTTPLTAAIISDPAAPPTEPVVEPEDDPEEPPPATGGQVQPIPAADSIVTAPQIDVFMQNSLGNYDVNINGVKTKYDTSLALNGCGPSAMINILRITGQTNGLTDKQLMDKILTEDNFYMNCTSGGCASGADSILKALQNNYGYADIYKEWHNKAIVNNSSLTNQSGIFVYNGEVKDPNTNVGRTIFHNAAFVIDNGNITVYDSYVGNGKPVSCEAEGDHNIKCGSATYLIAPADGTESKKPAALYPVTDIP